MSSSDDPDFKPYTIPYTSSGAVQVSSHYHPSSKTVGGSVKASSEFPSAPEFSSGSTGGPPPPPPGTTVDVPVTAQEAPGPKSLDSGSEAGSQNTVASKTAIPTVCGSPGPATTASEFTASATAPFQDAPHPRFQQTPQFPSSHVGLRPQGPSAPGGGAH